MEDSDSVLVAGYKLDRYELLCPIASGGMASVWLARLRGKRGFEKLFAIKTIKTELIADPRFQEMFLDEARIASRIEHPNVAQIIDLGEQNENLFIVMEWVDGESLTKISRLALKRDKKIPVALAMRLIADACAGLHAAHELRDAEGGRLGVVHRDVSPHNILVNTAGAAKVIDFGVATAEDRGAAQTESGIVKGKVRYMAPEQVNSQPVDHRADVWAAGMCLYELVAGHPPFDELGDVDVVRRLMSEDPVPPLGKLDVPEPVLQVLKQALAAAPSDRFKNAASMKRAIEAALDQIDAPSSSEDVADFVREHLSDLEKKRRETIAKAIDAAKIRALQPADDALPVSARAVPLMKKKAGETAPPAEGDSGRVNPTSYGSRTTGGATLTEQLGPREESRLGVWVALAVVVLGLGAWFVWPGSARIRAAISPPAPTQEPSATPPPTSVATAAPSTIELDTPAPSRSTSPLTSAAPPQPTARDPRLTAPTASPALSGPATLWGQEGGAWWLQREPFSAPDASSPQTPPTTPQTPSTAPTNANGADAQP